MTTVDTVSVDIVARIDKLESQLRKVDSTTKRTAGKVEQNFGKLNATFTRLGAAMAGAFSVQQIANFGRQAVMLADQLDKTSQRLGVNVKQLQRYQFAAEQSGIATNTFNMAIQRMIRRVAEAAQGTGEAQQTLKDFGIDAQAFAKLGLDEQLTILSRKFSDIEDSSERARRAFKLFDSEGVAMLQLLNQGEEDVAALTRKFDELGLGLEGDTIQRLVEAKDQFAILQRRLVAFTAKVMPPLLTAINKLADANQRFLQFAKDFNPILIAYRRLKDEIEELNQEGPQMSRWLDATAESLTGVTRQTQMLAQTPIDLSPASQSAQEFLDKLEKIAEQIEKDNRLYGLEGAARKVEEFKILLEENAEAMKELGAQGEIAGQRILEGLNEQATREALEKQRREIERQWNDITPVFKDSIERGLDDGVQDSARKAADEFNRSFDDVGTRFGDVLEDAILGRGIKSIEDLGERFKEILIGDVIGSVMGGLGIGGGRGGGGGFGISDIASGVGNLKTLFGGGGNLASSFIVSNPGVATSLGLAKGGAAGAMGPVQFTTGGKMLTSAFNPMNMLGGYAGSMLADALGLGGGIGGTIGGTLGSVAGGAVGGTALGATLGSAAGPVGAALGALAGTALGGAFGPTPNPHSEFGVNLTNLDDLRIGSKHMSEEQAQALAGSIIPEIAALNRLGIKMPNALLRGGFNTAALGGKQFFQFVTPGQANIGGRVDTGQAGRTIAFDASNQQDAARAMNEVLGEILKRSMATDSGMESVLNRLRNGAIDAQQAMQQLAEQQEENAEEAEKQAQRLQNLTRLEDEFARIQRDIQEEIRRNEIDRLQDTASEARRAANEFDSLISSLASASFGLNIGGLSPLSSAQQLQTARGEFERVRQAALGGDAEAIGRLQQVGRSFLEESRNFNASSPAFASDFATVQSALQQAQGVAEQQAATQRGIAEQAEEEIRQLNRQQVTELQLLNEKVEALNLTNTRLARDIARAVTEERQRRA